MPSLKEIAEKLEAIDTKMLRWTAPFFEEDQPSEEEVRAEMHQLARECRQLASAIRRSPEYSSEKLSTRTPISMCTVVSTPRSLTDDEVAEVNRRTEKTLRERGLMGGSR